ncbi:hypothetical protein ACNIS1_25845, partial [Escherichia coli]
LKGGVGGGNYFLFGGWCLEYLWVGCGWGILSFFFVLEEKKNKKELLKNKWPTGHNDEHLRIHNRPRVGYIPHEKNETKP